MNEKGKNKSGSLFIEYKDVSEKREGKALNRIYRRRLYGHSYGTCYLYGAGLVLAGLLAILVVFLQSELTKRAACSWIHENINEQEEFRATPVNEQLFSYMVAEKVEGRGEKLSELLTDMYFYERVYHKEFTGAKSQQKKLSFLKKDFQKEYQCLLASNQAIWADVVYFPVAASSRDESCSVTFGNSWRFERSYGGKRSHEGCDIMADVNERGLYPVVSITDGVIEQKGWLEKGGYRLGIRSSHGAYFYYAHLYSYGDLEVGDQVRAGEFLGFMGDSGYGGEGTTGKFAVHLHMGIYITTEHNREQSVNPYPVMRYLENKKIVMDYGKN